MKRFIYITAGILLSAGVVISLTWLAGAMFGPLYQGEDESTRNFKIFLLVLLVSIIAGGIFGNKLYTTKRKLN